jgi:Fe-S oxidoreductase
VTSTYDPTEPRYVDEAETRQELTRVFDVCLGCRRCVDRCDAFPTLFALVDRQAQPEAGRLTPLEQDLVSDECFHCGRCVLDCPYSPSSASIDGTVDGDVDGGVDVPALMLRTMAMRRANHHLSIRERAVPGLFGLGGRAGRLAARVPAVANAVSGAAPGSIARGALRAVTGLSATRLLPPFARQRFSTWFAKRPKVRMAEPQASVAVFPTCLVEYHDPTIGHDLIKVYERNGIECRLPSGLACCGAGLLQAGDLAGFARAARSNVAVLAAAVRDGHDVVVPQSTCAQVLREDYPAHVPTDDARLVASRSFDACEYLLKVHRGDETMLDIEFPGPVPPAISYHVSCHLRAAGIGLPGRDLLELTGARVVLAEQCSGANGLWGLGAAHDAAGARRTAALVDELERAGSTGSVVVAGDCHLANTAVAGRTATTPRHPLQVLARAYGIAEER